MADWYQKIQDEFHRERNTQAFYQTQGHKKLWNAYKDTIKTEHFQRQIKALRIKYKIPKTGYRITESPWTHPPKDWKHYPDRMYWKSKIYLELKEVCIKYHFLPQDWEWVFEQYLFYNRTLISWEPNSHNLCFVSDMHTRRDSIGREITESEINTYPVTLHISPHASERDILDYVKKLYTTEIKPLQGIYKDKLSLIGKAKKKQGKKQRRNEFIYQNQDWSTKDLAAQVGKEFGEVLDPGHIKKIISLENAKRKDV